MTSIRGLLKGFLNEEGGAPSTQTSPDSGVGVSGGDQPTGGSGMSGFLSGTSRFLDTVQSKKNGLISDISNKLNSIKLPKDAEGTTKKRSHRKSGGDSAGDDDSSASEYGDGGDQPMYAEGTPAARRVSVESIDSLPETEAQQWRSAIANFVSELLKERLPNAQSKAEFEQYVMRHTGRSCFSRELKNQVGTVKIVSQTVLRNVAKFVTISLDQCSANDDFGPANTLMQLSFTLFHQTVTREGMAQQAYLYTLLRDHSIWQSLRFWNAAFFTTLQRERAVRERGTEKEALAETEMQEDWQENITYSLLSQFVWNMYAMNLGKEACLDFLRKQAIAENLSKEKFKIIRGNLEKCYGSFQT